MNVSATCTWVSDLVLIQLSSYLIHLTPSIVSTSLRMTLHCSTTLVLWGVTTTPSVQNKGEKNCECDSLHFTQEQRLLSWIPKSGRVGKPNINEIVHDSITEDSSTIVKLFNWDFGISPWPNLTPGLLYRAYEIMSQLICFNGQRGILDGDKTLALILPWAKNNDE